MKENSMVIRNPHVPQLNLSRNAYEPPIAVSMEAFFEFSFWISEELLDLEAQFANKTAVVSVNAQKMA